MLYLVLRGGRRVRIKYFINPTEKQNDWSNANFIYDFIFRK
jgi:hypothetical protein